MQSVLWDTKQGSKSKQTCQQLHPSHVFILTIVAIVTVSLQELGVIT